MSATDAPIVTVLLCVRNGAATLARQLDALAAQEHPGPWELVVVDNGSTDATPAVLARAADRLPGLRIVGEARVGLNRARNRGLLEVRSPLVVCCDADDEAEPGWLRAMVEGLGRFDVVGGVLEVDHLDARQVRVTGRTARPPAAFIQQDELPRLFGFPYAVGANLGFARHVAEAIGGFDEAFRIGCDEVEFCLRAQLAGFSIGFVPDAVVRYRVRQTVREVVRQSALHGAGRQRLVTKAVALGIVTTSPWERWRRLGAKATRLALRLPEALDVGSRIGYAGEVSYLAGEAGYLAGETVTVRRRS